MDKWMACGIEVSARELMVAIEGEGRVKRFANTAAGHRALLGALTRGGKRVRAVMEATGMYGLDAALALEGKPGVELMVANPRAVRDFARALMQRSKNDRQDAEMLREFAARMPFQAWVRPSKNVLELWAITRRVQALVKQRTAEKNRAHAARISAATPRVVRQEIAASLRALERSIVRLRREAQRCVAADAQLQRREILLRSITGVGAVSAVMLLAELAMLPADRDVRQWVAFAGLDPREYSSGSSVRKKTRISKVGNRHLRHALYMPALVASRYEPHLRAFYLRLLGRGKTRRQAVLAVARKLLHAIYGMFRSGQTYDGTRLFASPRHGLTTKRESTRKRRGG